jgi:hypothetical protein
MGGDCYICYEVEGAAIISFLLYFGLNIDFYLLLLPTDILYLFGESHGIENY